MVAARRAAPHPAEADRGPWMTGPADDGYATCHLGSGYREGHHRGPEQPEPQIWCARGHTERGCPDRKPTPGPADHKQHGVDKVPAVSHAESRVQRNGSRWPRVTIDPPADRPRPRVTRTSGFRPPGAREWAIAASLLAISAGHRDRLPLLVASSTHAWMEKASAMRVRARTRSTCCCGPASSRSPPARRACVFVPSAATPLESMNSRPARSTTISRSEVTTAAS